jgi:hypothetical protein
MAELIADDKPENPFVGIPFPGAPLGLYNGKPWFFPSRECGTSFWIG